MVSPLRLQIAVKFREETFLEPDGFVNFCNT